MGLYRDGEISELYLGTANGFDEISEAYLGTANGFDLVYQALPSYIKDGLQLNLDASKNIKTGFDKTSAVWRDITDNGNDFSIINSSVTNIFDSGYVNANLLKNTDTQSSITSSSSDQTSIWWSTSGGNGTVSIIDVSNDAPHNIQYGFKVSGNTSGNKDFSQKISGRLTSGQHYIASFYARGKGTVLFRIWDDTAGSARNQQTLAIDTAVWKYINFQFDVTANMANASRDIRYQLGVTGTSTIEFCGVKLEKDWIPTMWCPNSDDSDYVGDYVGKNALNKEVMSFNPFNLGTSAKVLREGYDPWTWSTGFTYEFVLRPTDLRAHSIFTTKPLSSSREAWLTSNNNRLGIHIDGSNTYNTNNVLEKGKFTTITIARGSASSETGSASLNVYVDGEWKSNWSTSSVSMSPTGFYLLTRDANEQQFNGQAYAVRIYNRSLNREEIAHNNQLDRVKYDTTYPFTNKKAGLKSLNVLELIDHQATETNATFTQNDDGTWTKGRTIDGASYTQGCIWAEIDITDYRFINFKMRVTFNGGDNTNSIKGICTQSTITETSQSLTYMVDMGKSVGNRWGTIDVSALSGVWKVGIQTGIQLGTITNITAWA